MIQILSTRFSLYVFELVAFVKVRRRRSHFGLIVNYIFLLFWISAFCLVHFTIFRLQQISMRLTFACFCDLLLVMPYLIYLATHLSSVNITCLDRLVYLFVIRHIFGIWQVQIHTTVGALQSSILVLEKCPISVFLEKYLDFIKFRV